MKVFITGSTDGLGKLAAIDLLNQGHQVVLHARNPDRKEDILHEITMAEDVVIGDLSSVDETKRLANSVNEIGKFDAIIHNAGIYTASRSEIFRVNCLAPYILTSMLQRPNRLIYLSSGMHFGGKVDVSDLSHGVSYSDSKLLILLLMNAVARKWHGVYANAVNPGWVPTKMGGKNAPDDLQKGVNTQVWLAVSDEIGAKVSGNYFFHKKQVEYNSLADDVHLQNKFLERCERISGVKFPE